MRRGLEALLDGGAQVQVESKGLKAAYHVLGSSVEIPVFPVSKGGVKCFQPGWTGYDPTSTPAYMNTVQR